MMKENNTPANTNPAGKKDKITIEGILTDAPATAATIEGVLADAPTTAAIPADTAPIIAPPPAPQRTEVVFILDRSGSMGGLEADTIGGYNSMLKRQQEEPGEATITTVLFDDRYELLHDRIPLAGIRPITNKEYYVRGNTALLDAMGRTIHKIANVQKHTAPDMRAGKVVFVITTDGMENASREFTADTLRALVTRQQEKYGWEFIFLGANIDAVETAERYGISRDRAANYHADEMGTRLNFSVVGEAISEMRSSGLVREDWKRQIDEDFAKRGGKKRK